MNSLPGMLSGLDDFDGSIAHNSSYTSSDLNITLVIDISGELLDERSLRQRLLILDVISLVNTDEKNVHWLPQGLMIGYYLDGVYQE